MLRIFPWLCFSKQGLWAALDSLFRCSTLRLILDLYTKINWICEKLVPFYSDPNYFFSPEEARRILDKLDIHYTPKHGNWLNMAEIELSILSRQCLDRRIPDQDTLKKEVAAWQAARNALGSPMEWRFTTEDARVKLKKLYPTVLN